MMLVIIIDLAQAQAFLGFRVFQSSVSSLKKSHVVRHDQGAIAQSGHPTGIDRSSRRRALEEEEEDDAPRAATVAAPPAYRPATNINDRAEAE